MCLRWNILRSCHFVAEVSFNYLDNSHLFSSSPSFRIQGLGIGFSSLYPTTSPELKNHKIWYMSIETKTHLENYKNAYSRVFLKATVVFFCKFRCNCVPLYPPLYLYYHGLLNTGHGCICLTSLLNIFWAIQLELFFMSFFRNNC